MCREGAVVAFAEAEKPVLDVTFLLEKGSYGASTKGIFYACVRRCQKNTYKKNNRKIYHPI